MAPPSKSNLKGLLMLRASSTLVVAIAMLAPFTAQAAGSIFATEPGADGFNINTKIFNGSSYEITKLTFDFTDSHTTDGSRIVIDGIPTITAPDGGSASFFGSGSIFGFNFTGFTTFEKFGFKWDPDSAINGNYVATGFDFIGASVTAVTTGGTYFGKFERVGGTPDVTASLSPLPVPEPESYALALVGLGIMGVVARRRTQQA